MKYPYRFVAINIAVRYLIYVKKYIYIILLSMDLIIRLTRRFSRLWVKRRRAGSYKILLFYTVSKLCYQKKRTKKKEKNPKERSRRITILARGT